MLRCICVLSLFLAIGCGEEAPEDTGPRGTISGSVTLDGKPVTNATVGFASKNGNFAMSATTDEAGKYTLSQGDYSTVPATEYAVTVSSFEESSEGYDPEKPDAQESKSLLPVKYGDETQSGLSTTVKEGENTYDIKLEAGTD